jgi:hypothetical protein
MGTFVLIESISGSELRQMLRAFAEFKDPKQLETYVITTSSLYLGLIVAVMHQLMSCIGL